jgi:hypothetical protein
VAEALDHAHRKRDAAGRDLAIVHRDVSPQNVLVGYEGEVKLIDFGIAKAANKASRTQAGILKGKFGYMSPEQVRGLPVDRRSDVFALGIVLYELLTNERLFVADSDFAVLEKVRAVDVVPPRAFTPQLPEALERTVLRALARDPADRFAWASELQESLARVEHGAEAVTQRDLARFMKSTFAEDLEREKVKAAEVEAFHLPAHMSPAAREAGRGPLPAIRRHVPAPPEPPDDPTVRAEAPDWLSTAETSPRIPTPPRPHLAWAVAGALAAAAAVWLALGAPGGAAAYLVVDPEPADAEVLLDGKQVKPPGAAAPSTVEVAPGEHELRVRAPGRVDHVQRLSMRAGERLPLRVTLPPAPEAVSR